MRASHGTVRLHLDYVAGVIPDGCNDDHCRICEAHDEGLKKGASIARFHVQQGGHDARLWGRLEALRDV